MSYLSEDELVNLNFGRIGKNVKISSKASLYGVERMVIGDNVRIDDFCILSGGVTIGSYVHIAAFSFLSAWDERIEIDDFVNISSRVNIYTSSDDYSGASLTSPLVSNEYKKVQIGKVHLKKHVIVGVNSVVMPGLVIGEGTAIGALSFIKGDTAPWSIYAGVPATRVKGRKKDLLKLEAEFLK